MKQVAMTVLGVVSITGSATAEGTCQTNLNTWRSLLPKRLMGLAISTLLITFIAAAAHADDVLTLGTAPTNINGANNSNPSVTSTYTFNSSMILNSIGFVTSSVTGLVYKYSINGGASYTTVTTGLAPAVNGVRWFSLATPITLNDTDVVKVFTQNQKQNNPNIHLYAFTAVPGFNITVVGNNRGQVAKTNSNLRVSALAPNVAPEPGTLALALTGGCALVGMVIRRRRISN